MRIRIQFTAATTAKRPCWTPKHPRRGHSRRDGPKARTHHLVLVVLILADWSSHHIETSRGDVKARGKCIPPFDSIPFHLLHRFLRPRVSSPTVVFTWIIGFLVSTSRRGKRDCHTNSYRAPNDCGFCARSGCAPSQLPTIVPKQSKQLATVERRYQMTRDFVSTGNTLSKPPHRGTLGNQHSRQLPAESTRCKTACGLARSLGRPSRQFADCQPGHKHIKTCASAEAGSQNSLLDLLASCPGQWWGV